MCCPCDLCVIVCNCVLQTPPLAMVQQFCTDAAAWLAADPTNVVVVHCKVSSRVLSYSRALDWGGALAMPGTTLDSSLAAG
jgi:hypothetical protein